MGGFRRLSASGSFGQGVYRVRDGGEGGETGRVSGRKQNGRCSGRWETERRMHRAAARASDRKRAVGGEGCGKWQELGGGKFCRVAKSGRKQGGRMVCWE